MTRIRLCVSVDPRVDKAINDIAQQIEAQIKAPVSKSRIIEMLIVEGIKTLDTSKEENA